MAERRRRPSALRDGGADVGGSVRRRSIDVDEEATERYGGGGDEDDEDDDDDDPLGGNPALENLELLRPRILAACPHLAAEIERGHQQTRSGHDQALSTCDEGRLAELHRIVDDSMWFSQSQFSVPDAQADAWATDELRHVGEYIQYAPPHVVFDDAHNDAPRNEGR